MVCVGVFRVLHGQLGLVLYINLRGMFLKLSTTELSITFANVALATSTALVKLIKGTISGPYKLEFQYRIDTHIHMFYDVSSRVVR